VFHVEPDYLICRSCKRETSAKDAGTHRVCGYCGLDNRDVTLDTSLKYLAAWTKETSKLLSDSLPIADIVEKHLKKRNPLINP